MTLHTGKWGTAGILAAALLTLCAAAANAGNDRPVIAVSDGGSAEGSTWPMPKFRFDAAKMPQAQPWERSGMSLGARQTPGVYIDAVEPRAGANARRR